MFDTAETAPLQADHIKAYRHIHKTMHHQIIKAHFENSSSLAKIHRPPDNHFLPPSDTSPRKTPGTHRLLATVHFSPTGICNVVFQNLYPVFFHRRCFPHKNARPACILIAFLFHLFFIFLIKIFDKGSLVNWPPPTFQRLYMSFRSISFIFSKIISRNHPGILRHQAVFRSPLPQYLPLRSADTFRITFDNRNLADLNFRNRHRIIKQKIWLLPQAWK